MKSIKWAIGLLLLLEVSAGDVWADRGRGHWQGHRHGHFGVLIGPYWGAGYYASPFYYPPYTPYSSVVVEQADPPVYIEQQATLPERDEVLPALPQPGFWYYCQATQGYYPYVKECPAGWQKVAPQPSSKP